MFRSASFLFLFLFSLSLILSILSACSSRSTADTLADIETYIQDRPDSALSAIGQLLHSKGRQATAGLEYKNPWIGIVTSLRGTWSRTGQDLLLGSVIEGMLVRQESLPIAHHSDRYGFEVAFSQRINVLATTLGLALNRTWQQAQILRQEQLIPSRRGLWQGRLTATTRLSDKAQLFYRGSGSAVTSRIEGGDDLSHYTYIQQSLAGQFSLGKRFRLDGSVEHYFNDAISGSHRHIVFADLTFAWIRGQTELRIEARNLFNHREFNYATSNNLIDTSTVSPYRFSGSAPIVLRSWWDGTASLKCFA